MNRLHLLTLTWLTSIALASAIDYQQLSVAKRLRTEKRYDEAIQKLEAIATKATEPEENYHYLDIAIDIATRSLKSADRALALADEVKSPPHRDFAHLQILSDFQRYDEALALVKDKNIDDWPLRWRGQAHLILAVIHHDKKDDPAALEQWLKALDSPGSEISTRGRSAREAAVIYLKQGKPDEAEKRLRQALSITPANYAWRTESLSALASLLVEQRRTKEAVQLFDDLDFKKISSDHARAIVLESFARTLLAAGKKIKAIETFDQLLQTNIPQASKDRINQELDRMAEEF